MIRIETSQTETIEPLLREVFTAQYQAQFHDELPKKHERLVIAATLADELVGGLIAKQDFENLHVSLLAVKPEFQNQKIGSRLLQALSDWAQEEGVINLTLTTKSYQAVEFYQKNGFTIFGSLPDTPMRGVTKYYLYKRVTK
ncbi:GNAT family N-acetyltransferase [Enterococcus sp. MJM12]|uniref:GNAT family N-acetyltransferase n=1 Tax=Candidatus Enterococcus myersii TaxID=2815322 RepID=A0ABS3H5C4_9ENTE|nr:GNAT family N-acetyltransferase [Enterococcus sp. MJM12]MBO0448247.1 GNAT family N-acetyltransferase [Enterococcus sp. MJM12]